MRYIGKTQLAAVHIERPLKSIFNGFCITCLYLCNSSISSNCSIRVTYRSRQNYLHFEVLDDNACLYLKKTQNEHTCTHAQTPFQACVNPPVRVFFSSSWELSIFLCSSSAPLVLQIGRRQETTISSSCWGRILNGKHLCCLRSGGIGIRRITWLGNAFCCVFTVFPLFQIPAPTA